MSAKIERLAMAALAPALQQALAGRVKRLGYLGEFFKCSGHQPDALLPFMAMTDALNEQQRAGILDRIPLGAMGSGDDIGAACVYLASREAGYVTGQTLHVNGGMAML